jgi:ribosomal protein S27AE
VAYIVLCLFSGLAGGFAGKVKGSSFWLWFLVSAIRPIIGVVAALLYRVDRDELRRECPNCGRIVKLHDALCTRCGAELEFPEEAIVPESQARSAAR